MLNSVVGNDWSWNTRTLSDLGTTVSNEGDFSDLCKSYFDFSEPTLNSTIYSEYEPETIRLTYGNDLNLIVIHQAVREKIIYILKKINHNLIEISNLEQKTFLPNVLPIDIKEIYRKANEILSYNKKYSESNLWEKYKKAVIPILNEYVVLMSNEFRGQSSTGCSVTIDDSKLEERIKLIEKYISAINRIGILKIIAHKVRDLKSTCPLCLREIDTNSLNEEIGKYICECGFIEDTVKHISEYHDGSKTIPQVNSTAINIKEFGISIDRLLCRSGEEYPQAEMFTKFDEFCYHNNLPLRYNVINKLVPQPSMQVIITLLQNTGYSNFYNLKHQIRVDYYGWESPKMTEVQEAAANKLYVDFQMKYLDKKKRKTNINKEILLCIILYMVGVNINSSDFKIPGSADTIAYSNQLINEIMPELGFNPDQIPDVRLFIS